MLLQDLFQFDMNDYQYISPVLPKENYHKANGECDLVLENNKNIIVVEMQNERVGSLENRTMIYTSKLYGKQWKKGDFLYENLKPVTIFWILNYHYNQKELEEYQILEKTFHKRFGNNLNIKICDIRKFSKKHTEYQLLFCAKTKEQLVPLKQNPKLKPIVDLIIKYNLDEKEYERMEVSNYMWSFDDEQKFRRMEAYREGLELGEKRGEKRGKLETATKMLSSGVPINNIQKFTGLSKKQILNYQKQQT